MRTVHYRDLVYFRSAFVGMILAKIVGIDPLGGRVIVRLTADRGAYRRGEEIEAYANEVIPRDRVRHHMGREWAVPPWRVEGLAEKDQPRWSFS